MNFIGNLHLSMNTALALIKKKQESKGASNEQLQKSDDSATSTPAAAIDYSTTSLSSILSDFFADIKAISDEEKALKLKNDQISTEDSLDRTEDNINVKVADSIHSFADTETVESTEPTEDSFLALKAKLDSKVANSEVSFADAETVKTPTDVIEDLCLSATAALARIHFEGVDKFTEAITARDEYIAAYDKLSERAESLGESSDEITDSDVKDQISRTKTFEKRTEQAKQILEDARAKVALSTGTAAAPVTDDEAKAEANKAESRFLDLEDLQAQLNSEIDALNQKWDNIETPPNERDSLMDEAGAKHNELARVNKELATLREQYDF